MQIERDLLGLCISCFVVGCGAQGISAEELCKTDADYVQRCQMRTLTDTELSQCAAVMRCYLGLYRPEYYAPQTTCLQKATTCGDPGKDPGYAACAQAALDSIPRGVAAQLSYTSACISKYGECERQGMKPSSSQTTLCGSGNEPAVYSDSTYNGLTRCMSGSCTELSKCIDKYLESTCGRL